MRRVLVTGSRVWESEWAIHEALSYEMLFAENHLVVVHGACPTGADLMADQWGVFIQQWFAPEFTVEVERHPARWTEFGKAAGPIRNQHMVNMGADVCHAFPTKTSRGTYDCIGRARAAGIPVVVHDGIH